MARTVSRLLGREQWPDLWMILLIVRGLGRGPPLQLTCRGWFIPDEKKKIIEINFIGIHVYYEKPKGSIFYLCNSIFVFVKCKKRNAKC